MAYKGGGGVSDLPPHSWGRVRALLRPVQHLGFTVGTLPPRKLLAAAAVLLVQGRAQLAPESCETD